MPLLLTLLVCTATPTSAPPPPSRSVSVRDAETTPGQRIRERAWKVSVVGGSIVAAGLGFLAAGAAITGSLPTDPTVQNTGRAFLVGGVMLAISGVLVGLLSIPMWTWKDDAVAVSLSPLGGAVRW